MLNESEQVELNGLVSGSEILANSFMMNHYPLLIQAMKQSYFFKPLMSLGLVITDTSSNCNTCCALVALKSNVRIVDSDGSSREESLLTFINKRGKKESGKGEFVTRVIIPKNKEDQIISGFIRMHEGDLTRIPIVSIAFHFQLEQDAIIQEAGIAVCTRDNQIHFVEEACNFLLKKRFDRFDDFKLLGDIILTYTGAAPELANENTDDEMKHLLSRVFKNGNEVEVIRNVN